mgnify:FL=1
MNEEIMIKAGFNKEVKAVKQNKCPICFMQVSMDDFTDQLSLKEYEISGICQACQNEIFDM